MKKSFFIVLMAVVAFAATSCSTTLKTIQEPQVRFELNSGDYVLSEQVVGEATITRILNVDWARLFTNRLGRINAPVYGMSIIPNLDDMYAIYDLLEKNPGYDFVMCPQFTGKAEGIQGLYVKTTVKVVARLGKLK